MVVHDDKTPKPRPAATAVAGRSDSAADATFSLDAELKRAGMTLADLERLTGKSRATVWRWRNGSVPAYARTIIRQQKLLRSLRAQLTNSPRGS